MIKKLLDNLFDNDWSCLHKWVSDDKLPIERCTKCGATRCGYGSFR